MCTGLPARKHLAAAAVQSFYAQNYPNRDLLILNHSKDDPQQFQLTAMLPAPPEGVVVRELLVERFPTLGQMRSAALDLLRKDTQFVVQWDDDDWSHPARISRQMNYLQAARNPGACCVLGSQIRYSWPHNTAFKHVNPESGIAGTILHPNDGNRYPERHTGEDSEFLTVNYVERHKHVVLCDLEQPELYLRFFHAGNLCAEENVMKTYARPTWRGIWVTDPRERGYLPPASRDYLLDTLVSAYGHTSLLATVRHVRCIKCNRRYMGELAFRKQGTYSQPLPPNRWRKIWIAKAAAVTPFEGLCRRCA